jgi:hypothetical protein
MIEIDLLAMELRDKLPHWLTQYPRNARIIALLLARAIAHAKPPDSLAPTDATQRSRGAVRLRSAAREAMNTQSESRSCCRRPD